MSEVLDKFWGGRGPLEVRGQPCQPVKTGREVTQPLQNTVQSVSHSEILTQTQ